MTRTICCFLAGVVLATGWASSDVVPAVSRGEYLDLAEAAVRAYDAARLERYLDDADRNGVHEHGFPRLTANLGTLLAAGRMAEHRALFKRMMDICCRDAKKGPMEKEGNEFSVKELVAVLLAVEKAELFGKDVTEAWRRDITAIDAWRCYRVKPKVGAKKAYNWCVFGCASEQMRLAAGLGGDPEFVERYVTDQMRWFDENGMWRDPNEPIVYDLVTRLQFAIILNAGYQGPSRAALEAHLDRAAEPTLAMQSASGEIPYCGRSNQFLHNDTLYAALCEWYAVRYRARGDVRQAARFKAAARRCVDGMRYWLSQKPVRHVKNRYPTGDGTRGSGIGCEAYAYFDKYMITMGSWAVLAASWADETPLPAVAEPTASAFVTSPQFHFVCLKAGDYSVQFDYKANRHYDANGLGRFHRRGAPPPLALSTPCSPQPKYRTEMTNETALAFIPLAKGPLEFVEAAATNGTAWAVWKRGGLDWRCRLTSDGLTSEVKGAGELKVQIPVFAFDGERETVVSPAGRLIEVWYRGWLCTYRTNGRFIDTGKTCCNRNGRYRAFQARGKGRLEVTVTITRVPDFKALAPHPRLFVPSGGFAAQKAVLMSDPVGRAALDRLIRQADQFLDGPFLTYEKEGRRLLHVSRAAIDRVGRLALAWKMTGERKYAERARDEARAVCAFRDWNPSHFLDVGEMTLAVALARDWLDEMLTEADRRLFAEAILRKALTAGHDGTLSVGWWTRTGNNWNQVCNGGLAIGAAAVRDEYPAVAEAVLHRSRLWLPDAMAVYAGGGFPEGVGYWEYATDYTVLALDVLKDHFADGAADLFALPGLDEQAEYVNWMTGPTGAYFNYSDSFASVIAERRPMAACWYLARCFDRDDALAAHERPLLKEGFDASRMTPFLLLWYRPPSARPAPTPPLARLLAGENAVAVLRSGTGRGDWYLGMKAGSPGVNHGHMDVGSFVLERDGVRWAVDLGSERYHRIEQMKTIDLWKREQSSSRWSLFRLGVEGHGTLMIDGARQAVDGLATFLFCREKPVPEAAIDLTPVYPAAKKAVRTFRLENKTLIVTDTLEGLAPGARVTWNMNTCARAEVNGSVLTLAQEDEARTMRRMRLTASPGEGLWEVASIAEPRMPADSPNPGVTRVRFARVVPAEGRLDFSVRFESM